jgi:hypothetical protein
MQFLIVTAILVAASTASAETISISRVAAVPPDVSRAHAELSKQLTPSAKEKVQRIAGSLGSKVDVKRNDKATMQVVSGQLTSQFPGLASNGPDIDSLMFLVMTDAANAEEAELKAAISETQSMSKQRDELRKKIAAAGAQAKSTTRPPSVTIATVVPPAYLKAPVPLAADASVAAMQQRIDELSQMSEMNQLRLQALMDQRTKLLVMLSNLLKSVSTTESGILKNLK